MLKGAASADATAAFAAKHQTGYAADFYGVVQGLTISSLGLGTYLGGADEETDANYARALRAAFAGGINVVDTAVNYRAQASERLLGRVLEELVEAGDLDREQVVVATKGGFNPRDAKSPERGGQALLAGIPEEEIVDGHCIHPAYLERMLARSHENLGLEAIDIYYLHNPETQLPQVSKPIFYQRVRKAFGVLEAARKRGELGGYGVATWSGFRLAADDPAALDLRRLVETARSVGGDDHGFRFAQLPVSLALPEGVGRAGQRVEEELLPAIAAARRLGLTVVGSGPLAQAKLVKEGLPERAAGLDDVETWQGLSPAQTAIHFARSSGVDCTLIGMSSPEHVAENLAVARRLRAGRAEVLRAAGTA